MGAVTILKWEQDLNGWMKAVTKVGTWYAHEDGHWRLPDSWGATMTNGNLDGAKAICEADYIQRCTEFLHLYNPATHVVVSNSLAHHAMLTCLETAEKIDCKDCVAAAHELRAALEGGR